MIKEKLHLNRQERKQTIDLVVASMCNVVELDVFCKFMIGSQVHSINWLGMDVRAYQVYSAQTKYLMCSLYSVRIIH